VSEESVNDKYTESIEKAIALLAKFSVPLYFKQNDHPVLYGTGFFVKDGSDFFLVSAAHVFDMAKNDGLFFYSSPGIIRHLSGTMLRTSGEADRNKDLIDIGVLKLSKGYTPPYPEVDKFAMDISYLRPGYRPRTGKNYVLIGFPATKSNLNRQNATITAAPYAFMNSSINEPEYCQHGLDPDTHLVLHLNLKKGFAVDGSHTHYPKPQGMSGAPIVALYNEEDDDDTDVFPVVAVATRFRNQSNILFGTDTSYVLDAIRNSY
jgi:hypothetical protein